MPVRFDPLLASGLARDIERCWAGQRAGFARLVPDRREVWVGFPEAESCSRALGFLLHPSAGFVLARPEAPLPASAEERRRDFRRLYLTAVDCPPDERLLVLDFGGARAPGERSRSPAYRLYVELQTNQWNAVLVRGGDGRAEAALWPRRAGDRVIRNGSPYRPPGGPRRWAVGRPTAAQWADLLGPVEPPARRAVLLRHVAWTSSLNVDWILGKAAESDGPLEPARERYGTVRMAAAEGGEARLIPTGPVLQPYPLALGGSPAGASDLLDAMRQAAERAGFGDEGGGGGAEAGAPGARGSTNAVDAENVAALTRALREAILRLRRRRAALRRQLEGDSARELRELGHLLLARERKIPPGAATVSLEAFDGSTIEVTLDPRLDAVRNAQHLYERARRKERAARDLPARVSRVEERLARLQAALVRVRDGETDDDLWSLVGGRPARDGGRRAAPAADEPLPYRRYVSSGGLEIRVGRSARANDDLTFRHSAPDDIWLHARQAPGAHVILRWGRRDQNPPRSDLVEAAVLAAAASEARHSGLVAIDWTRRKYVRKPRKAPPGAVIPERIDTLFVQPDPTLARRLDPDV